MTRYLIHIGYPKTGSTFLQRWYEPRLYRARFAPLIAVLRAGREKKFSPDDLTDDVVRLCHGKATRLRAEPLYAPYAAGYPWDA